MISSWVQFQRTYHTATLPFYSHFSVLYSFVQMCTDLYILCILPRIISSDGLHDISLCSQKNKKEKKNEKRDEGQLREMEGGGFLGLEIEREAKGTKCNLDKAVSLLTSSSRPLNRNIPIYIFYILCILYIFCILYIICALYII